MDGPRPRPADRHRHDHHRVRLADSLIRFLLITRRRVRAHQLSGYAASWAAVRRAASGHGARAWFFRNTSASDLFVEFIEWQSTGDAAIIERENLRAALNELNAAFPFEDSDTWQEAVL